MSTPAPPPSPTRGWSVSAVMIAASLGWAAMAIAAALLAEEETAPHNGPRLVRAQGLARP